MLNRRHIRTKVMQVIYALKRSKEINVASEEKFLQSSMENMYDLYLLLLSLLVKVHEKAKDQQEKSQQKHLLTSEDLNPNMKFIKNEFLVQLSDSLVLKNTLEKHKITNWELDNEYVEVISRAILESKIYTTYMDSEVASYKKDRQFVVDLFKEVIAPNEKLYNYLEDRNLTYEKSVQLKPHIVYLANSSNVKVGVTRKQQVPTRWIDQGASYAVPIAKTPNRYLCGVIEVALKAYLSDRTAWQRMLKNEIAHIDLAAKRDEIIQLIPEEYQQYVLSDEEVLHINFPVNEYPVKVKSLSFDKTPVIEGRLMGIKGQYLLFEGGQVLNMRKHQAYVLEFCADENESGVGVELSLDF